MKPSRLPVPSQRHPLKKGLQQEYPPNWYPRQQGSTPTKRVYPYKQGRPAGQAYSSQRPIAAQYSSQEQRRPYYSGDHNDTCELPPFGNTTRQPRPPSSMLYHDPALYAAAPAEYRTYESQTLPLQPYQNDARQVPSQSGQYSLVNGIGQAKIDNGQIALLTDTIPRYITDAAVIRNAGSLEIKGGQLMLGDTRSVSHLMKVNASLREEKKTKSEHEEQVNIDDEEGYLR